MTDRDEASALADLAEAAARAAGRLLRDERPAVLEVDRKSSPTDVVTQMDRAAEALLVERLLGARPDDGVLGEEGADRPGRSGVRWVIDPIDGTVNYLYDSAQWAVCVAAEVDGEAVAGVVYDPSREVLFRAVRGAGATRDGEPLRLGAARPVAAELGQALVGTGFGYAAERRAAQGRVVAAVLPRIRDLRRLGAASLDLCAVAEGRLDAYWEHGLKPWDHAAAGLVAAEAGAVVGGLHGAPAGEPLTIAAAPGLFGPLHDLLAELGADRD